MKRCPQCDRVETDDALAFCRVDGTRLVSDSQDSESSVTLKLSPDSQGSAKPSTQELESSPSIAVLPFVNMSADPDNEYFCDGLAEELLNALAKIQGLKVAARTSAFSFKGKNANVSEIGKTLGVKTVLEGSVRLSGKRLRISAQLVDTANGYHLWTERYDREMSDVFDVQDEITLSVVGTLKVRLLGEEKAAVLRRYTDNTEAYELYLKGRHFWDKRTAEDMQKGIAHFQAAIDLDPGYAPAYAGLSDCYCILGAIRLMHPQEAFTKARILAEQALALDEALAEAHGSLGMVKAFFEWDFGGADNEFRRALEIDPNYARGHLGLAAFTSIVRQDTDLVLREVRKALALDPLSLSNRQNVGLHYYFCKQYDLAREQALTILELNPQYYSAHMLLGLVQLAEGNRSEALPAFERAGESNLPFHLGALGYAYAFAGQTEAAHTVLNKLLAQREQGFVSAYDIALVYVGLEDENHAFEWLERAYEECASWLIYVGVDPRFDSLHDNSRFQDLVQRLPPERSRAENK